MSATPTEKGLLPTLAAKFGEVTAVAIDEVVHDWLVANGLELRPKRKSRVEHGKAMAPVMVEARKRLVDQRYQAAWVEIQDHLKRHPGASYASLARRLNDIKTPPLRGGSRWSAATVGKVVRTFDKSPAP